MHNRFLRKDKVPSIHKCPAGLDGSAALCALLRKKQEKSGVLKQGGLFRRRILSLTRQPLLPQETLAAEVEHVPLLGIAQGAPVKTLLPAAQAAAAKPFRIHLADAAAGAGNGKKLQLLGHEPLLGNLQLRGTGGE